MATIAFELRPGDALFPMSNFPQLQTIQGTNFPVQVLSFDASTEETCYFAFLATAYGSGNITVTANWYADTATSGDIIWGCALAAITQNTDTQDVETKAFATAQTATDSHLGTAGQRLHNIDITVSNLDSVASGDWVVLKLYRDADAAGDTMTGDGHLLSVRVSYSDT